MTYLIRKGPSMSDPSPSAQPVGAGVSPKRSRRRSVTSIVVIVVLVAGLIALGMYMRRTAAASAAVGDCLERASGDSVAIVECDDPEAAFEVVGRVEDQTEIEAGISTCGPFEDQGSTQVYWEGEQGGTGFVLCLAERNA
jgi:hypothetical protein